MKKILAVIVLVSVVFLSGSMVSKGSETAADEKCGEGFPVYAKADAESLEYYEQVAQVLKTCRNNDLAIPASEKNTVAHFYDSNKVMYERGKSLVDLNLSIGFPFAEIVSEMHGDPFVSLNGLIDSGLLKADGKHLSASADEGVDFNFVNQDVAMGRLCLNSLLFPQEKKTFEFSQQGCEELVERIVMLAKTAEGNLNSLSRNLMVPEIRYSEADDCYYSFVVRYNTSTAYVTAVYMTSDDGKTVTDLKIRYMFIGFPLGDSEAGASIVVNRALCESRFEMITLITAAEQVMAGDCYFASRIDIPRNHYRTNYVIPKEYQVSDHTATLTKDKYITENRESFEVYSYSLSRNE